MRPILLLMLFLLSGCQKDFEQRYSEVESEVKKDAVQIDGDIRKDAEKNRKYSYSTSLSINRAATVNKVLTMQPVVCTMQDNI